MAGPAITVDGLDELRRDLRRVKNKELDDELKKIHKDIAREIGRLAAPMVPVGETLKLWKSVRAFGNLQGAVGKAGGASVPYAPPQHWGWPAHNIRGHFFLTRAADKIEQSVVDDYDRAVAGMLNRVIG